MVGVRRCAGASVVMACATIGLIASGAAAGTFTVTTAADAGAGSLRQAIADANAAGGGTINVTTSGVLTLASPLPIIAAPLTLNGNKLVVSGDNKYRPF